MSDRTLTCRDCGQQFVFTEGEQAFYTERGFSEPTRCKPCRDVRKQQRNAGGGGGGGYDSFGGGGGGFGGGGFSTGGGGGFGGGGGYNQAPRQMFPATCSECGQPTEVPFQPRTDKPVFCRECFQARRQSPPRSGYGNY